MKMGLRIFVFFIVTVIIAFAGQKDRSAENVRSNLNMDFRVITDENSRYILLCKASNNTDNAIAAHLFMNSGNIVEYRKLSPDTQIPYGYFGRQVKVKHKEKAFVNIQTGSEHMWNLPKSMIIRNDNIVGHYCKLVWHLSGYNSYPIFFGFPDEQGRICFPENDMQNFRINTVLAYVFNKHAEHELGFLMLNGTSEPVILEKPLTQASRITASAPAIEYTCDLFIPNQEPVEITIEPGKVGEWRLPWRKILELIPKEDLEKIKAAGGNLDLVWKVGEHESSPLPISLAVPKEE